MTPTSPLQLRNAARWNEREAQVALALGDKARAARLARQAEALWAHHDFLISEGEEA